MPSVLHADQKQKFPNSTPPPKNSEKKKDILLDVYMLQLKRRKKVLKPEQKVSGEGRSSQMLCPNNIKKQKNREHGT